MVVPSHTVAWPRMVSVTSACCDPLPGLDDRMSGVPGCTTNAFASVATSPPVVAAAACPPSGASAPTDTLSSACVGLSTIAPITVMPPPRLKVVLPSQCVFWPITSMSTLSPCRAVFGVREAMTAVLGVTTKPAETTSLPVVALTNRRPSAANCETDTVNCATLGPRISVSSIVMPGPKANTVVPLNPVY